MLIAEVLSDQLIRSFNAQLMQSQSKMHLVSTRSDITPHRLLQFPLSPFLSLLNLRITISVSFTRDMASQRPLHLLFDLLWQYESLLQWVRDNAASSLSFSVRQSILDQLPLEAYLNTSLLNRVLSLTMSQTPQKYSKRLICEDSTSLLTMPLDNQVMNDVLQSGEKMGVRFRT